MKSIMQQKDGCCYLCQLLNGDYSQKHPLEEHHAIYGNARRKLSEQYGLKVYLCIQHHRLGSDAVHRNMQISNLVKDKAQRAFEAHYPNLDFLSIFGKNYKIDETEGEENGLNEKGERL